MGFTKSNGTLKIQLCSAVHKRMFGFLRQDETSHFLKSIFWVFDFKVDAQAAFFVDVEAAVWPTSDL